MKTDIKGVSQCPAGQESYEEFEVRGRKMYQYDYRTVEGELFSCVARSLDECRERRDRQLKKLEERS